MIDVTCAILIKEGKVLAVQRSKRMKLPLKWEFPGGKVESGESARECLIREIREELGLGISIKEALTPAAYDYGSFQIRLLPFIAQIESGILQLAEHSDYGWFDVEELPLLDWAAADVAVMEEVCAWLRGELF